MSMLDSEERRPSDLRYVGVVEEWEVHWARP
jgi:hypothetical protein